MKTDPPIIHPRGDVARPRWTNLTEAPTVRFQNSNLRGEGVLVSHLDTGMDGDHLARGERVSTFMGFACESLDLVPVPMHDPDVCDAILIGVSEDEFGRDRSSNALTAIENAGRSSGMQAVSTHCLEICGAVILRAPIGLMREVLAHPLVPQQN